jgi:uncharacterized protein with NRDE domain
MCVVTMAWEAHPKWRLLVAGNRDEFHARSSAPVARWGDHIGVMAGRDLVSGGTWMGVSDAGRFAVVTNIRDADGPDPNKTSRGALVSDYLAAGDLPDALEGFNPFNLIVVGPQDAHYLSNRPSSIRAMLNPGIHSLSNAIPNEHWPRKDRLDTAVADWLAGDATEPANLFEALYDETSPDREAYPIFIRSPVYGTRCSTIIAVDQEGQGQIVERRFDAGGGVTGETAIDFVWA